MNDDSKRELDVFTEALELPVAERAAFQNRACAGNEGLQHKVAELLKVHERTGNFLERAPTSSVVEAMRGVPVVKKPGDQIALQHVSTGSVTIGHSREAAKL